MNFVQESFARRARLQESLVPGKREWNTAMMSARFPVAPQSVGEDLALNLQVDVKEAGKHN